MSSGAPVGWSFESTANHWVPTLVVGISLSLSLSVSRCVCLSLQLWCALNQFSLRGGAQRSALSPLPLRALKQLSHARLLPLMLKCGLACHGTVAEGLARAHHPRGWCGRVCLATLWSMISLTGNSAS